MNLPPIKKTALALKDLQLSVNLGWRKKERGAEQAVLLNINICFIQPPKACESDDLSDTLCYAKLIEKLREKVAEKNYRLIEHLASDIYQLIKQQLPLEANITIYITKYPQIDGLIGGASFEYGDS